MEKARFRVAAHADGRIVSAIPQNRAAEIAQARAGATNLAGSSLGGGYEGAQRQRRMFGFRPTEAAINSLLVFAGQTLRARARYLVRNNPYARKAQRVFVTNLVGTGIRPVPLTDNETLKDQIGTLWNDWSEEADADGICDLNGLQTLVARALFDAGECFVRFRPRRASDGLSVPLQIQVMESEFCPYELNMMADNGNVVRAGIEFNKIGQRVAYYFWHTHPGEFALPWSKVGWHRIPASEVLHVFEPLRPGQIRGVSWLAAAIVRAYIFDQYEDAELERKKTAALFAGFVERPDSQVDDPPLGQQDQPGAGVADPSLNADQEVIAGLTPGMLQVLLPGEKMSFSTPADVGPNFEAFTYRALLSLCASMDMPYASVTGDYHKANYSSLRASLLDMRAAVAQLQTLFIFQMCRGVYRRWFSDAVLSGALAIQARAFSAQPRQFLRARWIPPRKEWVDPQKDVEAEIRAVRAGLESREAVVMARAGTTLEEMDAAIARGNQSADVHGLVLDSDPRRTNARGSGAPPDDVPTTPETPAQERDDVEDDPNEEEAA